MTKQKLLTKEILKKLPPLYTNEQKDPSEIKVPLKFFNPCGAGTWFATEFEPATGTFFGFVNLGDDSEAELGYFTLSELQEIQAYNRFRLPIERDAHWNPNTSLEDVLNFRKR